MTLRERRFPCSPGSQVPVSESSGKKPLHLPLYFTCFLGMNFTIGSKLVFRYFSPTGIRSLKKKTHERHFSVERIHG